MTDSGSDEPTEAEFLEAREGSQWHYDHATSVSGDEHFECNCVPDLGPSHCHGCGEIAGHPVEWANRKCPSGVGVKK